MNLLHTGEETLMKRRIIKIDENKCNGCGLCAKACHEGAIGMVNGKAKLLRDDYCDGLGDCLPHCPTDAITFEEREALPYDREAVEAKMRAEGKPVPPQGICPGSRVKMMAPKGGCPGSRMKIMDQAGKAAAPAAPAEAPVSQLRQWPVQIKLVPIQAPFASNDIKSVTVVRMEVPCCGGLEHAAVKALQDSGKMIPWSVVTISTDGRILDRT